MKDYEYDNSLLLNIVFLAFALLVDYGNSFNLIPSIFLLDVGAVKGS